jgi:hypothetical protein
LRAPISARRNRYLTQGIFLLAEFSHVIGFHGFFLMYK